MLFFVSLSLAVVLGIFFPYSALSLMPYGFVFFFVLMLASGLSAQGKRLAGMAEQLPVLAFGLFLCFVFLPLLQLTLARLIISDSYYLTGIYFGALAPVAIVAPFFTKAVGGDEELAHLLMVSSSILFPFVAVAMLLLVPMPNIQLDLQPLAKGMLVLVVLPVILSVILGFLVPGLRARLERILPLLNSVCLAALVFILFGSAAGRLNLSYASGSDLVKLLCLGFFQDFGVLLLGAFLAPRFFPRKTALALAVSLSMKNTAIAATLLLFYSPAAAIPATLIFIPHAILFGTIPRMSRYLG